MLTGAYNDLCHNNSGRIIRRRCYAGIENPAPKTSMIEMKFGVQDFVCLAIGVAFCVVSIMVG